MTWRRPLVLAGLLLLAEGAAWLVDWRWPFRDQLRGALSAASVQLAGDPPEEDWEHPAAPFAPDFTAHAQALRFRSTTGVEPTGRSLGPDELPAPRTFVLGESAAFGVGVRAEETFASLLDQRLAAKGLHVVNAGQPGASPWQVLDAGAQLLTRYSPAGLVIFTGNNQWFLWKPPQQAGGSPWALEILSALSASRAIAGLELLLIRRTVQQGADDRFHDHHDLTGSRYALRFPLEESPVFKPADWPPVKQRFLQRFQTSLEVLVDQARSREVPVVLVTVPFNYRLAPSWKHPQFEAFDPAHRDQVRQLLHEAARQAEAGDCSAALANVDRALALDPLPPVLHYLRAECLEKVQRLDEAEAAYAQSREQMMGNLGSRLSTNEVIRNVAAARKIPLVDAAKLFDEHSHRSGRHFNDGLFVDDCHFTPEGHQIVANALEPLVGRP